MNILFRLLLRPQIMVFLAVLLISAMFGTHKSGTFSSKPAKGADNPWSKDYDPAAHRQARSSATSSRATSYRTASGERVSAEEVAELRRDEEYRRKMLREMRKAHEERLGSTAAGVDLSDY